MSGTLPSQLAGTLYRVGPGTYKVSDSKFRVSHWFDGFSHLHRFHLVPREDDSGTLTGTCNVFYTSRRQVDPLIEQARKDGRLKGLSFGQKRDPCETFFQKVKAVFEPAVSTKAPDMVNVGVTVRANVSQS